MSERVTMPEILPSVRTSTAGFDFDNTFAILVRGEDARRLNLKTVSDAAKYARQWQAGFGHDFMVRPDGNAQAYDATADAAYGRMRDNLADLGDRAKDRAKDEGRWPPRKS